MALTVTTRRVLSGASKSTPAPLTLEEQRKLHQLGTLERVVIELKEDERLSDIAKEHANAANRQGTQVKNAMKSFAVATEMQPTDQLQIGEYGYRYDVSISDKVDVRALYKMMQEKKISEEEFLQSISVNKTDAERNIGPHKLLMITTSTPGKTLDIRKDKLDAVVKEPKVVRVSGVKPQKLKIASQTAPPKVTASTVKKLTFTRRISTR
jgi:hypothetical protein